ncbi:MAG: FAD-dependent oxidoreductase [Proteobacteria bacterium]|nr:FAD-dependent oxidoreductase [Pseudomonadota bacterium]
MSIKVAIVGSGPAGFYTADALLDTLGDSVEIALIDRLLCPYGLIRAGVAPDHQTTKRVARAFEKTALHPRVAFFGNVEVGRDIAMAELTRLFDAVVIAIGAPHDRALGIPGEDRQGMYGSAAVVGWYNGHPDFCQLEPMLDTEAVVVIGNGNVAIDVARVLVKTRAEMANSDLPAYAADAIERAPIRDVYLVGRRGPLEAKFTNVELREMGKLDNCAPVVDADDLPASAETLTDARDRRLKEKNLNTLREFTTLSAEGKRKRVHFVFYAQPLEIKGAKRVSAVTFERTKLLDGRIRGTGETFDLACGMAVAAIGYQSAPLETLAFDTQTGVFVSDKGLIQSGVYAVGWAMRGPSGVIASNRPDGVAVATRIATEITPTGKPATEGLARLLDSRAIRVVDFAAWKRIEAAEIAAATEPAPRRKLTTTEAMLDVLNGKPPIRSNNDARSLKVDG